MTTNSASTGWAPWWVYLIAIVATDQLRSQLLIPDGTDTWLQILIRVASMLVVAFLSVAGRRPWTRCRGRARPGR
jgi:hypothetical protein